MSTDYAMGERFAVDVLGWSTSEYLIWANTKGDQADDGFMD